MERLCAELPSTKKASILTNDMTRSARDILALYKKPWDIELFFKWLKQNLKIKKFLGRSENAAKIQIYVAIITYLLASLAHKVSGTKNSKRLFVAALKTGLFQQPPIEQCIYKKTRKEIAEMFSMQRSLSL